MKVLRVHLRAPIRSLANKTGSRSAIISAGQGTVIERDDDGVTVEHNGNAIFIPFNNIKFLEVTLGKETQQKKPGRPPKETTETRAEKARKSAGVTSG